MPPDDCKRRELVAVILRAILTVLHAIDKYYGAGVFARHKDS